MKHQMTLNDKNHLLTKMLKKLGNQKPDSNHLTLIASLMSTSVFGNNVLLHPCLTDRETSCLVLAAKGMTSEETADLLGVKSSTVETYRRNIKQKLSCNTIAQAVFEGLRFGYIAKCIGE